MPDPNIPWFQPGSRVVLFFFFSFSTPDTGGLSGSLGILGRAMEGQDRQRGRGCLPAQYIREEKGRKITPVWT